jgi:hypothetical protein
MLNSRGLLEIRQKLACFAFAKAQWLDQNLYTKRLSPTLVLELQVECDFGRSPSHKK